jgi:hypothetical protein
MIFAPRHYGSLKYGRNSYDHWSSVEKWIPITQVPPVEVWVPIIILTAPWVPVAPLGEQWVPPNV